MENQKKRRGAPSGRRPVVWICSAIVNQKLVSEKITITDQTPDEVFGSFPKEMAEAQFREINGVMPAIVYGPFAETRKAGQAIMPTKKQKLSIVRDLKDLKLSNKKVPAIFENWQGVLHFLENEEEKGLFIFTQENVEGSTKTAPAPGVVSVADITFMEN